MKTHYRINLDFKDSATIRKDGADRCRVVGCQIPMAKDWEARAVDGGRVPYHAATCGNHPMDKPGLKFPIVLPI